MFELREESELNSIKWKRKKKLFKWLWSLSGISNHWRCSSSADDETFYFSMKKKNRIQCSAIIKFPHGSLNHLRLIRWLSSHSVEVILDLLLIPKFNTFSMGCSSTNVKLYRLQFWLLRIMSFLNASVLFFDLLQAAYRGRVWKWNNLADLRLLGGGSFPVYETRWYQFAHHNWMQQEGKVCTFFFFFSQI